MDAVASLYDRNNLYHIIEAACREVFIPITIGGGIRSVNDIDRALKVGADKIAADEAIKQPQVIREASRIYGSQCIVGSIEAKKKGTLGAYIDNGRESTGVDAIDWAKQLEELGAGEIILTSVDNERTKRGFDLELSKAITESVDIPVIVSGVGSFESIKELADICDLGGVAIASILHYNIADVSSIKQYLIKEGILIRK